MDLKLRFWMWMVWSIALVMVDILVGAGIDVYVVSNRKTTMDFQTMTYQRSSDYGYCVRVCRHLGKECVMFTATVRTEQSPFVECYLSKLWVAKSSLLQDDGYITIYISPSFELIDSRFYHTSRTLMTYFEALNYCWNTHEAELLTLDTEAKKTEAARLLTRRPESSVWLSLKKPEDGADYAPFWVLRNEAKLPFDPPQCADIKAEYSCFYYQYSPVARKWTIRSNDVCGIKRYVVCHKD